jgi:hypothetical protein
VTERAQVETDRAPWLPTKATNTTKSTSKPRSKRMTALPSDRATAWWRLNDYIVFPADDSSQTEYSVRHCRCGPATQPGCGLGP